MDTTLVIIMVHAAATLMMTGLIWFVQVVHYPLFHRVGTAEFSDYEQLHCRRTSLVVMPLMLGELASAAWLSMTDLPGEAAWIANTGIVLLAIIWLSTAALQVPCHRQLETGFDDAIIRRLVTSNWVRTIAWTGRSALALLLLTPTS